MVCSSVSFTPETEKELLEASEGGTNHLVPVCDEQMKKGKDTFKKLSRVVRKERISKISSG